MSEAAPVSVELSPRTLRLQWRDKATELDAAKLRSVCRCGGCRSRPGLADPALRLIDAAPVGHYALNLIFSDGHDRGIYPWSWLRELAERSVAL